MYFNEEIFKVLRKLEELPDSEEKEEMGRAYQNDEITIYELVNKARLLIEETKNENDNI